MDEADGGPVLTRVALAAFAWWVVWCGMLNSLLLIYWFIGRGLPVATHEVTLPVEFAGVLPLAAATLLRWFFLLRVINGPKAFLIFIIGMGLAESAGLLGLFLSRAHRLEWVLAGALGIAQWVPVFAQRFYRRPELDSRP